MCKCLLSSTHRKKHQTSSYYLWLKRLGMKIACCQIKKKVGHNNKIMFDLSKRILDIWNCFYDRQFIFFCCYNFSIIIRLMNKNALSLVCYYIILFHILNFIAFHDFPLIFKYNVFTLRHLCIKQEITKQELSN